MTPIDPYATIHDAAIAAELAIGAERSPKALIRLQMALVQDLGRAFGRELTDEEAAAMTILCARLIVPVLSADLCADSADVHVLTAEDAAHVTACIGVNVLAAIRSVAVGDA